MAKVVPQPIGSPLESFLSPDDYRAYRVAMDEAARPILEGREKVRDGWGQEYRDRVHKKGKLTAWERIERLKDPGSRIFPINTFVNYDVEFEGGKFCPGAGVVTAFVRVADRYTVVIANDNTVASGAWWPLTPEKIERAQWIALRLRLPVIYLVDCSGLFLPEQARSFPGADHLGPRLHDRAGLHGHRGRGAHQGRQVAEHHVAHDRRPGHPRPHLELRGLPGAGRRVRAEAHPA
jgi:acetyl-CoA carboxylase carboxyltransferase component